MPNSLFLPTEIPWKDLKGKELEELLYWLFDAMGAKDLEWRIGGVNSGTADQGRDLELSFYTSSPDGELVKQRWWVEAKGRSGTVEPYDVKNAVLERGWKEQYQCDGDRHQCCIFKPDQRLGERMAREEFTPEDQAVGKD